MEHGLLLRHHHHHDDGSHWNLQSLSGHWALLNQTKCQDSMCVCHDKFSREIYRTCFDMPCDRISLVVGNHGHHHWAWRGGHRRHLTAEFDKLIKMRHGHIHTLDSVGHLALGGLRSAGQKFLSSLLLNLTLGIPICDANNFQERGHQDFGCGSSFLVYRLWLKEKFRNIGDKIAW